MTDSHYDSHYDSHHDSTNTPSTHYNTPSHSPSFDSKSNGKSSTSVTSTVTSTVGSTIMSTVSLFHQLIPSLGGNTLSLPRSSTPDYKRNDDIPLNSTGNSLLLISNKRRLRNSFLRFLIKFIQAFIVFVAIVFFWLISPEKPEFRPPGYVITNFTCNQPGDSISSPFTLSDNGWSWENASLGPLKQEYRKSWSNPSSASHDIKLDKHGQPILQLGKFLHDTSSLGNSYSFANLDAYPILKNGLPLTIEEMRRRFRNSRYNVTRLDGRICFSNLPNGNNGEGPGVKPFDSNIPISSGWHHDSTSSHHSLIQKTRKKKYLILLAEKNERLDFINNFHASLLSVGANHDTKTIIWTHDPCRLEYVLLLDHYRGEYGMDIELRQMPDAVLKGEGEGGMGWIGKGMKIEYARFIVYREFLERSFEKESWEKVMLSDKDYDVVFQRHPFKEYPILKNGISFSAEWKDFTIGDCQHHRGWIKCGEPWWGNGIMSSMKPFPRLCAGVIIGYVEAVVKFIQILTDEILLTSCNDQGILNYMYYSCRLSRDIPNVVVWSNEKGLGGTIGSNPHYWVNGWGDVVNHDGEVQVFVHQYKWHQYIINHFNRKYPLPSTSKMQSYYTITCRTRVYLFCFYSSEKPWPWTDGDNGTFWHWLWMLLFRIENWVLKHIIRPVSGYRF